MKVLKEENMVPIKMWAEEVEEEAEKQLLNLSRLPFAFSHIAVMPDCHMGYGMPIGGVLATVDTIIPNAVGVDIGCGMLATKTSMINIDVDSIKKIMGLIRKEVPVGFNHHQQKQQHVVFDHINNVMGKGFFSLNLNKSICLQELESAKKQLGTLGGGNHFIELQKGSDGFIWFMIHSGSRNLGKKVADHYNKLAVDLNAKWHSNVPPEHELAFLPDDSDEGRAYILEMELCVQFALANRQHMQHNISKCIGDVLGCSFDEPINIAHNYAAKERHFGENVWVHRKGATLADSGTIGVIPGSQGDKSYIVKGRGNRDSFKSCSHGAGRKLSRKKAQKVLSLEEQIKILDDQGIVHGLRNVSDLDEAPGAYKSISDVMKNQEDLVDILVELSPLASIKA